MLAGKVASVCELKEEPREARIFSQLVAMPRDLLELTSFELCYHHLSLFFAGASPPHLGQKFCLSEPSPEFVQVCPHLEHSCSAW